MPNIRANGIEIEYDITGPEDGIPMLFINGFGSQMTSWPRRIPSGAGSARHARHPVRQPRCRPGPEVARHRSQPARGRRKAVRAGRKPDVPYTLSDMATDAAALLTALGIDTAHIAGCSMGGMIAQLVALNHPEKARSLISIFSTTSDPSLPQSSPEAQAALTTPSPGNRSRDGDRTFAERSPHLRLHQRRGRSMRCVSAS